MSVTKLINVTVAIWSTQITMTENDDNTITVKMPFQKLSSANNYVLDHSIINIYNPKTIKVVKKFFENDETVNDVGMTLEAIVYGAYSWLPLK